MGEIQRITAELDTETLQRVQLENEKNGLEEELSFLRQMHAQELEDLRQKSFLDVGLDSSQFFKSELANAIREIRNEYEQINGNQRAEMEQWYANLNLINIYFYSIIQVFYLTLTFEALISLNYAFFFFKDSEYYKVNEILKKKKKRFRIVFYF